MKDMLQIQELIDNIDLEPIVFTLVSREEGPGWTIEKSKLIETWYRRFLALVKIYPDQTIVPTKDIDMFWHYHILDTRKYMEDCDKIFGSYFHHFPYFGSRGKEDKANFEKTFFHAQELFEKHFGESPISAGIADCGGLCSDGEPTPYVNIQPNLRPSLATIEA
jgi:hypothetical protein